jgi:hypothetical protein
MLPFDALDVFGVRALPEAPNLSNVRSQNRRRELRLRSRSYVSCFVKRGRRVCGLFRTSPYPLAAETLGASVARRAPCSIPPRTAGRGEDFLQDQILQVQLAKRAPQTPGAGQKTGRPLGRRGRFRRNQTANRQQTNCNRNTRFSQDAADDRDSLSDLILLCYGRSTATVVDQMRMGMMM